MKLSLLIHDDADIYEVVYEAPTIRSITRCSNDNPMEQDYSWDELQPRIQNLIMEKINE